MTSQFEIVNYHIEMEHEDVPPENQVQDDSRSRPIWKQLNLDLTRLPNVDDPIYKRLHNIIANDVQHSELSFRRNLINQLYFLLQMVPVFNEDVKDTFLKVIEKWYNQNDHKKVDVENNKISDIYKIIYKKKSLIRPKSGTPWCQQVNPFLRPYTAQRRSLVKSRPDSSKTKQSTMAETIDLELREYQPTIREEQEISMDFKNKQRTAHPEYEPVYEQLFSILKKAENLKPKVEIAAKPMEPKIVDYPAVNNSAAEEEEDLNGEYLQGQGDVFDEANSSLESEKDENLLESQKQIFHPFKSDSSNKEQEGFRQKQSVGNTLNIYKHFLTNRNTQNIKVDEEIARRYVNIARAKSAVRTQINTKNEKRRLISAKSASRVCTISVAKNIDSSSKQNLFDFTSEAVQPTKIDPRPTYNQRKVFRPIIEKTLSQFRLSKAQGKPQGNSQGNPQGKSQGNQRSLTSVQFADSSLRFDPFSADNIAHHNKEAVEQIERIKSKLKGDYASTDSLMKALYIPGTRFDVPWHARDIGYCMISNGQKVKKLKKGKLRRAK